MDLKIMVCKKRAALIMCPELKMTEYLSIIFKDWSKTCFSGKKL